MYVCRYHIKAPMYVLGVCFLSSTQDDGEPKTDFICGSEGSENAETCSIPKKQVVSGRQRETGQIYFKNENSTEETRSVSIRAKNPIN